MTKKENRKTPSFKDYVNFFLNLSEWVCNIFPDSPLSSKSPGPLPKASHMPHSQQAIWSNV